jgi:hypothetical protein
MTVTLQHHSVRKQYRRTMVVDGVTVRISQYHSVISGSNMIASVVQEKLTGWLNDGMIEGTPTGGYNKGPIYQ